MVGIYELLCGLHVVFANAVGDNGEVARDRGREEGKDGKEKMRKDY